MAVAEGVGANIDVGPGGSYAYLASAPSETLPGTAGTVAFDVTGGNKYMSLGGTEWVALTVAP